MSLDLSDLPTPAVIALAALLVVNITLLVVALAALWRTPHERLVFQRKWPWALVIVFINLIGPIVFLATGRRAAAIDEAQEPMPESGDGSVARVVEKLYGDDRA